MKCEVIIDESCEERAVIWARKRTRRVDEIERLISSDPYEIIGKRGRVTVRLQPGGVLYFTVFDGVVYAGCKDGRYAIGERLYALLELFGESFVKINQSTLANIRHIERFEATIGGAVAVVFKDGYRDYISRRQMKEVKERLGMKK